MRKKIVTALFIIGLLAIILFNRELTDSFIEASGAVPPVDTAEKNQNNRTDAKNGIYTLKSDGKETMKVFFDSMNSNSNKNSLMMFSGVRFTIYDESSEIKATAKFANFDTEQDEIQLTQLKGILINSDLETNISSEIAEIYREKKQLVLKRRVLIYNSLYTATANEMTYIY